MPTFVHNSGGEKVKIDDKKVTRKMNLVSRIGDTIILKESIPDIANSVFYDEDHILFANYACPIESQNKVYVVTNRYVSLGDGRYVNDIVVSNYDNDSNRWDQGYITVASDIDNSISIGGSGSGVLCSAVSIEDSIHIFYTRKVDNNLYLAEICHLVYNTITSEIEYLPSPFNNVSNVTDLTSFNYAGELQFIGSLSIKRDGEYDLTYRKFHGRLSGESGSVSILSTPPDSVTYSDSTRVAVVDDEIYLYGIINYHGLYVLKGGEWITLSTPPSISKMNDLLSLGGRVALVVVVSSYSSLYIYDPITDAWTLTTNMPFNRNTNSQGYSVFPLRNELHAICTDSYDSYYHSLHYIINTEYYKEVDDNG